MGAGTLCVAPGVLLLPSFSVLYVDGYTYRCAEAVLWPSVRARNIELPAARPACMLYGPSRVV